MTLAQPSLSFPADRKGWFSWRSFPCWVGVVAVGSPCVDENLLPGESPPSVLWQWKRPSVMIHQQCPRLAMLQLQRGGVSWHPSSAWATAAAAFSWRGALPGERTCGVIIRIRSSVICCNNEATVLWLKTYYNYMCCNKCTASLLRTDLVVYVPGNSFSVSTLRPALGNKTQA
jgi:hypothetical protein